MSFAEISSSTSFNEAPPFQAGKLEEPAQDVNSTSSFNEAPPFQAGKRDALDAVPMSAEMLQ